MKLTRSSNTFDCYKHLSKELTKTEANSNKWSDLIQYRYPDITKKTTWTTDQTHVCLGVELLDEFNTLSSTYSNIFHIDRDNMPGIKAIPGTQKIYSIFPDISNNEFITSVLPCSCPSCRINPTNISNCIFKNERDIQRKKIREMSDNDDEEEEDIISLSHAELKDVY